MTVYQSDTNYPNYLTEISSGSVQYDNVGDLWAGIGNYDGSPRGIGFGWSLFGNYTSNEGAAHAYGYNTTRFYTINSNFPNDWRDVGADNGEVPFEVGRVDGSPFGQFDLAELTVFSRYVSRRPQFEVMDTYLSSTYWLNDT
jgi:hypothetical protein